MPFNRCMHYPFAITCHDLSFTVWFQALNFLRRRELDILVDPALQGQCSQPCLEHAFFVVSRCISESPNMRPSMRDVVASLTVMSEVRNRRRLDRGGRSTPTRTIALIGTLDAAHQQELALFRTLDAAHQQELALIGTTRATIREKETEESSA